MNKLIFLATLALSGSAFSAVTSDTTVLSCRGDERASDGELQEVMITKNSSGSYHYSIRVEGSSMGTTYKKESRVDRSRCSFSPKYPGIGECNEVTAEGFRGKNRLSVALAFSEGRDQYRMIHYQMNEMGDEAVTLEVAFDLTSCVLQ